MAETNSLLSALSAGEHARMSSIGEDVALRAGDVLHDADESAEFVHFPRGGVISLMIEMKDGSAVETGMVGFEGAVGSEGVTGSDRLRTRAVVTVAGPALRVPAQALRELVAQSPAVREVLSNYRDRQLAETQQSAACGVLHKLDSRLCRWLSQAVDRLASTSIPLTQEHLAQRLGVHRATLNEASAILRRDGVIEEGRRGFICIKDRESLRNCACECYAQMQPTAAEPVA